MMFFCFCLFKYRNNFLSNKHFSKNIFLISKRFFLSFSIILLSSFYPNFMPCHLCLALPTLERRTCRTGGSPSEALSLMPSRAWPAKAQGVAFSSKAPEMALARLSGYWGQRPSWPARAMAANERAVGYSICRDSY